MTPLIFLAMWVGGSFTAVPPGSVVPPRADTIRIVPGAEYAASPIARFFLGDQYRDVWTTPVAIPVLDVTGYDGGLTATTAGGGRQTRNLRFESAAGGRYKFRLVHKRGDSFVPSGLTGTFVEDLVQDAMCLHFPYSTVVVEPLQRAAGLLTIPVDLYVLPDDDRLGEHREEFSGRLGAFSPRVGTGDSLTAGWDPTPIGILEELEETEIVHRTMSDPGVRVRAEEFLTARLLDMLVGDWDRHPGQWSWVALEGEAAGWRPVPEDRDVAFSRLDGVAWAFVRSRLPHVSHFGEDYGSVVRLHYQSRFLDRFLLSELERPVWDSMATRLRARLTDEVIERSLARIPSAAREVDDGVLRSALLRRRDALPDAAREWYRVLARRPDIHASHRPDLARISVDGTRIRIELATAAHPEPYFRRTFEAAETDEIRLYLHDGDDVVLTEGDTRLPIRLRLIGGAGDDRFVFHDRLAGARIYDAEGEIRLDGGAARAPLDRRPYPEHPVVPERGAPHPVRDWGVRGLPTLALGLDHDAGLIAGGRYDWSFFGFRKDPFATRLSLEGRVSSRLHKEVALGLELRAQNSTRLARFDAEVSDMRILHYFGPGNDSERLDPAPRHFYDAERLVAEAGVRVGKALGALSRVRGGVVGRYSHTGDREGSFLAEVGDLYGAGSFGTLGLEARVRATSKPDPLFTIVEPQARIDAEFAATLYPRMLDVETAYGTFDGRIGASVPLGLRASEVGARVGGRVVAGQAPWFDQAFIGGKGTLRGFRRERFAGDRSLYGSVELRLDLFDIQLLLPSTFGIHGVADVGRVWLDGASPGGWHRGVGGGLWFTLRGTRSSLALTYVGSDEGGGFYATLDFPF